MINLMSGVPAEIAASEFALTQSVIFFGDSIKGGRSSGSRNIRNMRTAPLSLSVDFTENFVSHLMINLMSGVPAEVSESESTLTQSVIFFGDSINKGRGGPGFRASEQVRNATAFLAERVIRLNPDLPPLVENEEGLPWSDEAKKRLAFCLEISPQLPYLAIARFIYVDASDKTVKRIDWQLQKMKKRSAVSSGGGKSLKKKKTVSGAIDERNVDDEDDIEEESVDDDDDDEADYDDEDGDDEVDYDDEDGDNEVDYDDEDDDDESDGVDTGFKCCNCKRDPKHVDDEWSYRGDDGYVYIADENDADVIARKDEVFCLREKCQTKLFPDSN